MKEKSAQLLALGIALNCVRNTSIENIHAGASPDAVNDDYSNVFIGTEESRVPWDNASRITDVEMKAFMIEVTNKIYTVLMNLDDEEFIQKFEDRARRSTIGWNKPKYLGSWFKKKESNTFKN